MIDSSKDRALVFKPQAGPQTLLFHCPATDILFGGARGGGKSYGVLGHFFRHAYTYHDKAIGIIFRKTHRELRNIIDKARNLYLDPSRPLGFFNKTESIIYLNNGATLFFRCLENDRDADKYQGHDYSWICIEEAGNFPSPIPIDKLRACLRSSHPMDKYFILTANPGGAGHNWLKAEYIDPVRPNKIQRVTKTVDFGNEEITASWDRVFIPSFLHNNKILMDNDPEYVANLIASAGGQQHLLKAWLYGDWNVVAGGMFDDVFDSTKHVLPPFKVPHTWDVHRSFDWGSSHPFSVGWWVVSDGSAIKINGADKYLPRGTLIRIGELYGWDGATPNVGLRLTESEIINRIFDRESEIQNKYGFSKITSGVADSSIFTEMDSNSIAAKHSMGGLHWLKSNKFAGSRVQTWQHIRQLLANSKEQIMEDKGLFVTSDCLQFLRTVPTLQRDSKKIDDIDTNAEDHIIDEVGYMVMHHFRGIQKVTLQNGGFI